MNKGPKALIQNWESEVDGKESEGREANTNPAATKKVRERRRDFGKCLCLRPWHSLTPCSCTMDLHSSSPDETTKLFSTIHDTKSCLDTHSNHTSKPRTKQFPPGPTSIEHQGQVFYSNEGFQISPIIFLKDNHGGGGELSNRRLAHPPTADLRSPGSNSISVPTATTLKAILR